MSKRWGGGGVLKLASAVNMGALDGGGGGVPISHVELLFVVFNVSIFFTFFFLRP